MNKFETFILNHTKDFPLLRNLFIKIYILLGNRGNQYSLVGKNNKIRKEGAIIKNTKIRIKGNNNNIYFGVKAYVNNLIIEIKGSNHNLVFGKDCQIKNGGCFWLEDDSCSLLIGDRTTIEKADIAITEPGSRIEIGEDCMLAYNIDIRCGDSHSIVDLTTDRRINFAENIKICNHVWIGAYAQILKGVTVGTHSIIGTRAVITKDVAPNSIVAGNPAREIRTGISWKRKRIYNDQH